jgi:hypothetical protein
MTGDIGKLVRYLTRYISITAMSGATTVVDSDHNPIYTENGIEAFMILIILHTREFWDMQKFTNARSYSLHHNTIQIFFRLREFHLQTFQCIYKQGRDMDEYHLRLAVQEPGIFSAALAQDIP